MAEGYNWFLILVAVVVSLLVVALSFHVLVNFQHPEDRNQAWFPKIIVLFGMTLAMLSVLMFPLDVANRQACEDHVAVSACRFALPMEDLWYTVYMMGSIMVLFLIPFASLYYEADPEFTTFKKVRSALIWVIVTATIASLTLGLAYGFAGYVEYPVEQLFSGIAPLDSATTGGACLPPEGMDGAGVNLCDASTVGVEHKTWTIRTSFPVYLIALSSAVGWVLFVLFAGIGIVALPVDFINAFAVRPQKAITKTQYMQSAKTLARRAKEIKEVATTLRREEQSGNKGRQWRKKVKKVNQSLAVLEEDQAKLDEVFPQGESADMMWVATVMGYWIKLALGVLTLVTSILWIVHVVLYILVDPPVSPFLNDFFIELDNAFPLFGVAAFAAFCFYLIAITIKGCTKFGLNLLIISVHPMRVGNTLISSFLFNIALILLSTQAVIQFCSKAYAVYAEQTEIQDIFGNEIEHLMGIKHLYADNIFVYAFLSVTGLTLFYYSIRWPNV